MFGVEGVEVIEPIELGETSFAVNLNRSNVGDIIRNAKDTDEIEIKFYCKGKDIGKYVRTPGTDGAAYNEVGAKVEGSYLIVDFIKYVGSLTDYTGKWIYEGDDIFIGLAVFKPST